MAPARAAAWRGAYGLEPSVEMYVRHSIEILRELRRVLRPDGVLFWNLGDSYCSQVGEGSGKHWRPGAGRADGIVDKRAQRNRNGISAPGLKPKDLVLMPARIALAAQADGWWVRSMIIWAKPNPMPESVTDRPTDSYEHILMLTKSARYFWDADAVREKGSGQKAGNRDYKYAGMEGHETKQGITSVADVPWNERNMRNVWDFATQPYAGAHFATFPEELPRRCILAASSARGACRFCGAPWTRIIEEIRSNESGSGKSGNRPNGKGAGGDQVREDHDVRMGPTVDTRTVGWSPTCLCRGQHGRTVPCLVLDPFAGSGTTGRVAIELNRRAVLLDLAYGRATAEDVEKGREYDRLALRRLSEIQRVLPL
jgi:DNA modification methylase